MSKHEEFDHGLTMQDESTPDGPDVWEVLLNGVCIWHRDYESCEAYVAGYRTALEEKVHTEPFGHYMRKHGFDPEARP